MTLDDEIRARQMYEEEAKNWPSPVGWDNLPKGTQYLWIQRVKERPVSS